MPPEFTTWRDRRCGSQRGVWHGLDGGGVGLGRWSMAAMWGGLNGGLIWVYGVGWSWFVWVCLVWVDLGCGLIWVCVEAWRWCCFDQRWFFFVWVDQCWLIWCWFFFDFGWRSGGFWWSFDWRVWRLVSDLMAFGFWFNGFWFLMMVVMVAVGLWERGSVRERGSEGVNNKN